MTFHLDQGLHLLETYNMVKNKKPRLIGPMVSSKTFDGRGFFIGPNYYYILATLGIISNWNPVTILVLLIIIELSFYILFAIFLKNKTNTVISISVFLYLSTSSYLITHSRFFWNPHFLIPLAILELIFFDKYLKSKKLIYLFLIGTIFGIAFSFHYSVLLWSIPLIIILHKNNILKIKHLLIIFISFLLGNLPFWVFEFRNSFYNLKTIFFVFNQSNKGSDISIYYFIFPFLIPFLYFYSLFLNKFYSKKILLNLLILIPLLFNLLFLIKNKTQTPQGHPKDWTYLIQQKVVSEILKDDCPLDYNVASTITGNTISYDLRYLLTTKKCPPMAIEDYPKSKILFLIASKNRPPQTETVWEVKSMQPFEIVSSTQLTDDYLLHKLKRI